MSRVKQVAKLLDTSARFSFTDFKIVLYVYTHEIVLTDALTGLTGGRYKATVKASGRARMMRIAAEDVLMMILETVLPHLVERGALCAAALRYLKADTADGMLAAIGDVQREMLKWPTQ